MIKEIRNYVVGLCLVVVCYIAGNLIIPIFWGLNADFTSFFGIIRALASAIVGVIIYYSCTKAIPFLEDRLLFIPPIIISIITLTIYFITAFILNLQSLPFYQNYQEMLSALAAPFAWLGFGFWAASQR